MEKVINFKSGEEIFFNNHLSKSIDLKKSNSPLYSPLKRVSEDTNSPNNFEESLVTRQPCLNGYTNTVDKIGSQLNNQNSLDECSSPKKDSKISLKASKFADVQSPGLKHALNNTDKNDKRAKLSIFQSEKYRTGTTGEKEEEKKNEK